MVEDMKKIKGKMEKRKMISMKNQATVINMETMEDMMTMITVPYQKQQNIESENMKKENIPILAVEMHPATKTVILL